jgi:hypothetical protein
LVQKFNAKLTKQNLLKNELDILLDHDYDGIKELDNNTTMVGVFILC